MKKKKKKKCNVLLRKVINYPSNEISNKVHVLIYPKKCAKELSIKIGNFVI